MRKFAAALAVAALAASGPGIAAAAGSKHPPCGKTKPDHTNCGKHLGHAK